MSFLEHAGGEGKRLVGMFVQAYATNLRDDFCGMWGDRG